MHFIMNPIKIITKKSWGDVAGAIHLELLKGPARLRDALHSYPEFLNYYGSRLRTSHTLEL